MSPGQKWLIDGNITFYKFCNTCIQIWKISKLTLRRLLPLGVRRNLTSLISSIIWHWKTGNSLSLRPSQASYDKQERRETKSLKKLKSTSRWNAVINVVLRLRSRTISKNVFSCSIGSKNWKRRLNVCDIEWRTVTNAEAMLTKKRISNLEILTDLTSKKKSRKLLGISMIQGDQLGRFNFKMWSFMHLEFFKNRWTIKYGFI